MIKKVISISYNHLRRFITPRADYRIRKFIGIEGRNGEIHSTRLSWVKRDAFFYSITGIAARCDWVLLTDWRGRKLYWSKKKAAYDHIYIYASVRQIFKAVLELDRCLNEKIIDRPFTLITGGEDDTLPRQIDVRQRPLNADESAAVARIATHPLLDTWFVENLDSNEYQKMRPIPCGVLPEQRYAPIPKPPSLATRNLRVLCAHRVRDGAQWEMRRRVSQFAESVWSTFCDSMPSEVSREEFGQLLESYPFVLCVEGGGLDPSPKAWETLLHGGIPIIRKSSVTEAYKNLPVIIVDDWTPDSLSVEKLEKWREQFSQIQDVEIERRKLVHKLSADYWWSVVTNKPTIK